MPNAGTLLTDAEWGALSPLFKTIGDKEKLIISFAESAVTNFCKTPLAQTSFVNQSIDIRQPELTFSQQVSQYVYDFRLPHGWITEWTELKFIVERENLYGLPSSYSAIDRNSYYVSMDAGIVSLLKNATLLMNPNLIFVETDLLMTGLMTSWPSGTNVMVATYKAGWPIESVPPQIKMAAAIAAGYYWQLFDRGAYMLQSVSGELGTTSYTRDDLPVEAKKLLRKYKRVITG